MKNPTITDIKQPSTCLAEILFQFLLYLVYALFCHKSYGGTLNLEFIGTSYQTCHNDVKLH